MVLINIPLSWYWNLIFNIFGFSCGFINRRVRSWIVPFRRLQNRQFHWFGKFEVNYYFFLFSENHIWMLLGSFHFILCRITITDRGHNGAYKPSSWTGGSLWSLSIMVSFPVEKLDWAHPFKVTNGKLSRKSRWFLCRDSLQINIQKETEK